MNILARLRFARAIRDRDFRFRYDPKTGAATTIERYSVVSDRVFIRHSRFGYVTGHSTCSRAEFENMRREATHA